MQSWEVLREATERVGVKAIAAKLKVSTALVYKWCQETPASGAGGSGARNPLDRLKLLMDVSGDTRVVNWLCNAADGFFVPNPKSEPVDRDEQLLGTTQQVVDDFGRLLSDIGRSIENDGEITPDEADTIRQAWERLKSHAEHFVVACERGLYDRPKQ